MRTNRRAFLGMTATASLLGLRPSLLSAQSSNVKFPPPRKAGPTSLPPPITSAERLQRIAKAQQLMRAAGLKALLIEAGSSLVYFTGVQWWRSERLTAGLIPAEGQPIIITPAFEEPSVRENLKVPAEVRVWNEHQSPFALARRLVASSWRRHGTCGRGRDHALLRIRRTASGRRRDPRRLRCRSRLPPHQVAGRDRADASGGRHHHRGLSRDSSADRAWHDAGRYRQHHVGRR